MGKEDIKFQPADNADVAAGQPPAQGATEELPDLTAEQFAGLSDEKKLAYMGNAKKFITTATQKTQEAAEIRKANEQLQAEREYYKSEYAKQKEMLDKYNEFLLQSQQQPEKSTPNQPPTYDPYNPDKSYDALKTFYEETRKKDYEELKSGLDKTREEFGVGLRTINIERFLEKNLPIHGKNVDGDDILLWFHMHPDIPADANTILQAIKERQTKFDVEVKKSTEEYLAQKEKDAQGAQEVPGAAFAGGAPDKDKWVNMSAAEREAEMTKFFTRRGG